MVIKNIIITQKFENDIKHVRDSAIKQKIKKQINKLVNFPNSGKPLKYALKGERTIYITSYRLIYSVSGDVLFLLRFEHRKEVYA